MIRRVNVIYATNTAMIAGYVLAVMTARKRVAYAMKKKYIWVSRLVY
jgi:hypothetical protein